MIDRAERARRARRVTTGDLSTWECCISSVCLAGVSKVRGQLESLRILLEEA